MLRILPEYNLPQKQEFDIKPHSAYIQKDQNTSSTDIVVETIAALIEYKIIKPNKLYFLFNQNFYNLSEEFLIDCVSIANPNIQSKILVMDLFNDTKLMKIFKRGDEFRPFGGYKFFSPEDRIFLHSDVSLNNPIHAYNYFKKPYMES